jgi:hypothetical protein
MDDPQAASRLRVRVISGRSFGGGHTGVGDAAKVQDPDHHFAISHLSAAMRSRNGFNALSLSSISRMRASAAASFCLNVAISAAAVALRSAMIAFVSRGRADRALPPSGFAKIFGDKAVIPSRHCRGTIPPAAAATFPHSGAGCDHAIGVVNGAFAAQPPSSRLAASASSSALSFLKTASMASSPLNH